MLAVLENERGDWMYLSRIKRERKRVLDMENLRDIEWGRNGQKKPKSM